MPGPLDALRGMMGGGGNGPARMQAMPGFSADDLSNLNEAKGSLADIAKFAKIGSKELNKLGAVQGLAKAEKALANLKDEEVAFNAVMEDGTNDIYARSAAYEKLATAQREAEKAVKDHTQAENEMAGMLGRTKNVLDDVATKGNIVKGIFVGLGEIVGMALKDSAANFDAMARSGQVLDNTFTGLASASANFTTEMRLASIKATAMGQSADVSNAQFLRLTETYGATGDVVNELGEKWADMSALATLSGLGLEDVADLASQGFKRLGEDIDTTMTNVALMATTVTDLNQQFGAGKVSAKDFSNAVQSLAYSSSFLNQNTKLVTESLGRELKMQLALGRAPEAALKKAQQNLELAGKVNIVGIMEFRDSVQAEYDAFEAGSDDQKKFLADFAEKHGSEGKILAGMLESGTLQSSENLFAVEQAVKNGASLQQDMMDSMRASAAEGDIGALMSKGLSIQEAQYMRAESRQLNKDIAATANPQGGVAARKALMGENYRDDPKKLEFLQKVRKGIGEEGGFKSKAAQQSAFLDLKSDRAEKMLEGEMSTTQWLEENIGKVYFGSLLKSVESIPKLLGSLPKILAGVLALAGIKGLLGKFLPSVLGGAAKGGLVRGAASMAGGAVRGAAGMAMGGLRGAAGLLGKAGPIALAVTAVGSFAYGMYNAAEILGKTDVTAAERAAVGVGQALEILTFGLLDAKDVAEHGGGWVKSMLPEWMGGTGDPLAPTAMDRGDSPEAKAAVEAARAKLRERGATVPVVTDGPVDAKGKNQETSGGGGVAVARGSVSGDVLTLEVLNWGTIGAQTAHENA